MPLYSVANPYPVILNQVGGGLNGGKVYIGVAGQDPETAPQAVYWDEAGTILASQPIDIVGGYITRAGTPATLYIPVLTYCIRVRDRFGAQVYYSAEVNDPVAALDASLDAAKANKDLNNLSTAITGLDANYQGSGKPAILHDTSTNFALSDPATGTDVANVTFLRNADYTGGSPGFTNNAIRAITTVGAGAAAYEWTATFIMENHSTAGENVGSYSIGRKHSTGPTWGALSEVIEVNAVNNPTSGTVAHELDVSANGTDNVFPYARVGCDLAIRRFNASGADIEVGWGYRIQNGGYANSLVRIGFGFYTGMKVADAFDCSLAVVSGSAFKMAADVPISFDAGAQHLLKYTTSQGLEYSAAGVVQFRAGSGGVTYQRPLTVATLPAAGQLGRRAIVSDATATTFNSVVAGGGANKAPVWDDGAVWRIG